MTAAKRTLFFFLPILVSAFEIELRQALGRLGIVDWFVGMPVADILPFRKPACAPS